ncbi:MAG: CAAX prenyl protease-related protein [Lentisphaerae bacterium]|nr:CAAX prenyl protease-related protein [Lentisphaerota bacterium]
MENIDSRRGLHLPPIAPSVAHTLPFAVGLLWMMIPGLSATTSYTGRTIATLVVLLFCRPWRWYRGPQMRHLPATMLVGALVTWVWILPESAWVQVHVPWFHAFYQRFGILGGDGQATAVFAPENVGWLHTTIRLCGSAFVIAMAEEFFWRGFVYRRLQQTQFLEAHPEDFSIVAFTIVALAFGFEHARWFVGIFAGVAYGLLYVKTRNLWSAILAHMITNWLLGLYVLRTQSYQFW